MADEVLKLAYEAALAALKEQDTSLKSVGNRATGLLSASALGTSFAAAIGVLNTDAARGPVVPQWAGWSMLTLVMLIGVACIMVLWPTSDWNFGTSPRTLLDHAGKDVDEVLSGATKALADAVDANERRIEVRSLLYRIGAMLLVGQTVVLVLALLASR